MSPEDPMRSATEALGAYFMGDVTVAERGENSAHRHDGGVMPPFGA